MHTLRRPAAALLTAAGLVVTPAVASASAALPMLRLPDPAPHAARSLAVTATELAGELGAEYAVTHQRRLHNEMVLVRHNPVLAVS